MPPEEPCPIAWPEIPIHAAQERQLRHKELLRQEPESATVTAGLWGGVALQLKRTLVTPLVMPIVTQCATIAETQCMCTPAGSSAQCCCLCCGSNSAALAGSLGASLPCLGAPGHSRCSGLGSPAPAPVRVGPKQGPQGSGGPRWACAHILAAACRGSWGSSTGARSVRCPAALPCPETAMPTSCQRRACTGCTARPPVATWPG